MDSLQEVVAAYLARRGLSQNDLASRAHVSQSTVSRVQSRRHVRRSRAQSRLFNYIQEQLAEELPPTVATAIKTTWDGTDAHAEALASLIAASRELWPGLGELPDDGDR